MNRSTRATCDKWKINARQRVPRVEAQVKRCHLSRISMDFMDTYALTYGSGSQKVQHSGEITKICGPISS